MVKSEASSSARSARRDDPARPDPSPKINLVEAETSLWGDGTCAELGIVKQAHKYAAGRRDVARDVGRDAQKGWIICRRRIPIGGQPENSETKLVAS